MGYLFSTHYGYRNPDIRDWVHWGENHDEGMQLLFKPTIYGFKYKTSNYHTILNVKYLDTKPSKEYKITEVTTIFMEGAITLSKTKQYLFLLTLAFLTGQRKFP